MAAETITNGGSTPRPDVAKKRRSMRSRISANSVTLWLCLGWMAVIGVAAIAPNMLAPIEDAATAPTLSLNEPGDEYAMGADHHGRSIYAVLVHGTRIAMIIGLAATAIGFVVGSLIGLVTAYVGGAVDMIAGRIMDMFLAFPGILLALVVTAALGPTVPNLILAVGISVVPSFYRLMRGQVLTVRSRLFIEAARSSGFNSMRILMRHVLPNSLAPVIVLATVTVGISIVFAASLSFLGLGPRSELPDWGQLLATGQPYLNNAWWISTFPGIVVTLTVIALSLLGDWLRDRLDAD